MTFNCRICGRQNRFKGKKSEVSRCVAKVKCQHCHGIIKLSKQPNGRIVTRQ